MRIRRRKSLADPGFSRAVTEFRQVMSRRRAIARDPRSARVMRTLNRDVVSRSVEIGCGTAAKRERDFERSRATA
jgi:hypothetical protein